MTPATVIESAAADGVMLAIATTGRIEATGQEDAVNQWLPIIRAHKAGIIEFLKVGASDTTEPFDREAWEERAAICEHDGGLPRTDAEAVAWLEDDRRRCCHCLNLLPNGICKVASPGGIVSASRNYRPVDIPRRCEGYRPCPDDPDRRPGRERWL